MNALLPSLSARRSPPECMDFDHRSDEIKLFEVGLNRLIKRAKLRTEIAKCDIVCANYHRIRTVARMKSCE